MSTMILNPLRISADIWRNRYLLGQLIKRDVLLRYRGAMFGVLWIFLSPLIMLTIFAFIFGHIFQARWPQQDAGVPFWLLLYSGLFVFAETVPAPRHRYAATPSEKISFGISCL
jgi:lipopolysaccharide transport system permease protein